MPYLGFLNDPLSLLAEQEKRVVTCSRMKYQGKGKTEKQCIK